MTIPTSTVTIDVLESDGTAVVAAVVTARLNTYDIYEDQIIHREVETTTTNGSGRATLALFPNVQGERGTAYVFTIRHPTTGRKIYQTVAQVLATDCNLTDIAGNVSNVSSASGPEADGLFRSLIVEGALSFGRGPIDSGLYTPVWTINSNLASIVGMEGQYLRVGDIVTASGVVIFDITAGNAPADARMSLPVASEFAVAETIPTASGNLGGSIVGTTVEASSFGLVGYIVADIDEDEARVVISSPVVTGEVLLSYHFTYRIIEP